MEIDITLVYKCELQPVYLAYYRFFEKLYGESEFSGYIKETMSRGEVPSTLVRSADSNYGNAIEAVGDAYKDNNCIMMGAYSSDKKLLATARIRFKVPGHEGSAIVAETVIIDEKMPENERTELYRSFVARIEDAIRGAVNSVDLLTFEVPQKDVAFITSVEELGYDIDKTGPQGTATYLFYKRIREVINKRTLYL